MMSNQNVEVREMLQTTLRERGLRMKYVSKSLDLDYTNLSKFKNGRVDYPMEKLTKLSGFLERYKELENV